ncbi:putative Peroxisomal membrane protein [Hibiscus syriacus]|uniref:Peroxisomal membrane protein n=1 Tax=Hibiscus syriacus TaxID=106335 RepID=A0A6A3CIN2_HIBSY|nr:putative Peroxisomal membrane protein [Hibiscus syriacus]
MATKMSSLFVGLLLAVGILLAISDQANAARDMPKNDGQMKHPEFLKHDRSVLIPGLGRVLLPPVFKHHHPHSTIGGGHAASGGSSGGYSGGTSTGENSQIPGGDDTFVPNPGFEVPIPGGRGVARP